MNPDFLSYVIPIFGSSLSLVLSVFSLFSAKKMSKSILRSKLSRSKNKQIRHCAKSNHEIARKESQDITTELYLPGEKIEQLQAEEMYKPMPQVEMCKLMLQEEIYKLILQLETSEKQKSEIHEPGADNLQVAVLEKTAISEIESIRTSEEKS